MFPAVRPNRSVGRVGSLDTLLLDGRTYPGVRGCAVMDVRLTEFEAAQHLGLLQGWLRRPHVTRWWGDATKALAHVAAQPPERHRIIAVDGHPCGYACWQPLSPTEVAIVGFESFGGTHIDIDILIGEGAYLGRGVGPVALQLIVELLASQGVSSTGLGTDVENARACRAFQKAGFQQSAEFQEGKRSLVYFTRDLGAAV